MGCMKLCGNFHITPEPGQGPRSIVPHCSGHGPGSTQCEFTITLFGDETYYLVMCFFNKKVNSRYNTSELL